MGELLDQLIIEVKNLAKFLEITTEEEVHHSEPYNQPKGQLFSGNQPSQEDRYNSPKEHIGQVMTGRNPRYEFDKPPRTEDEGKYLNRIESPLRVDGGLPVTAYRYGIWGEKIYVLKT